MRDTQLTRCHYILIIILTGLLFGTGSAYAECTPMAENVFADFDGDGIHDLASGSVSQSGFTYSISVRLSRHQTISRLRMDTVLPPGFRLIPADVDLDGDADLVLSRWLGLPVAVWANDGRGYFRAESVWGLIPEFQSAYLERTPRSPSTGTTNDTRISVPAPSSPPFEGHPSENLTQYSSRYISRSSPRQSQRGPPPASV